MASIGDKANRGERVVVVESTCPQRKASLWTFFRLGLCRCLVSRCGKWMKGMQKMPFGRDVRLSDLTILSPAVELQCYPL